MISYRVVTGLALAGVVALTGCSSSTSGTAKSSAAGTSSSAVTSSSASAAPVTSSAPPTTSSAPSPSSSSAAATGGFPSTLPALGALLTRAEVAMHSATIDLSTVTNGTSLVGHGVEKLANGKLAALDLTEKISTARVRIIVVGTRFYAQLPASVSHSSKPWVELTPRSKSAELRSLYASFEQSIQTGAGESIRRLVTAGTDLRFTGTSKIGSDTVGSYSLAVDVTRLPADFPGRAALISSGVKRIPLTLAVDTKGRPRKVTERVTFASTDARVVIALSNIDKPVHITAPPAGQIAH